MKLYVSTKEMSRRGAWETEGCLWPTFHCTSGGSSLDPLLTHIICELCILPPSFHINKLLLPNGTPCGDFITTSSLLPSHHSIDERCYKKVRAWPELGTAFSWRLFFSRSKSEANLLRSSSEFNFLSFVLGFHSPQLHLSLQCSSCPVNANDSHFCRPFHLGTTRPSDASLMSFRGVVHQVSPLICFFADCMASGDSSLRAMPPRP